MIKKFVFIGTFVLGAAAAPAQACVFSDAYCHEAGSDLVVTTSPEASALVAAIEGARVEFVRHFGGAPAASAVVEGSDRLNAHQDELLSQGFEVFLPWPARNGEDAQATAIRSQVEAQMAGLPQAQIDGVVAQAFAQAGIEPLQISPELEAGAVSHELGPLWLKGAFDWSKPVTAEGVRFYGAAAAPDWLDETAAVLMENDALTEGRYELLAQVIGGDDPRTLAPLADYLTMQHPSMVAVALAEGMFAEQLAEAQAGAGTRIVQLSGADAEAFLAQSGGMDAELFYSQTRGFIDFMLESSGNDRIFAEIAQALVDGESFASWLAANGERLHLPGTVSELQTNWDTWLGARFSD